MGYQDNIPPDNILVSPFTPGGYCPGDIVRGDIVRGDIVLEPTHGLSQHGVWVSFWTPKSSKSTPQDTQNFLWGIP